MNDYFTFFYVKHFELPLCMKCAIQINLPCLALPQIDNVDDCNSVSKDNDLSSDAGQQLLVSYVKGVIEGVEVSRLWFQCVANECRFLYVNSYTSHSSTEKRLCVSPCSEWTNVRYTGHHHCNIPAGNWIMAACISCAKRNHTDCVAGLGLSVEKSCITGPQPC